MKTAQDFAGCSTQGVRLGNDRAITYWLSFSLADWGFLAGILLLVMSFLEERQKGLTPIVRTCPRGRQKLQATRLVILLGFSLVMTLVLYALPLGISYYTFKLISYNADIYLGKREAEKRGLQIPVSF